MFDIFDVVQIFNMVSHMKDNPSASRLAGRAALLGDLIFVLPAPYDEIIRQIFGYPRTSDGEVVAIGGR